MTHIEQIRKYIAEVRARADAATPGPMIIQRYDNEGGDIHYQIETEDVTRNDMIFASVWNHKANAEFVKHAPVDIPTLLAMLESLLDGCEFYTAAGPIELAQDASFQRDKFGFDVMKPGKRAIHSIEKAANLLSNETTGE